MTTYLGRIQLLAKTAVDWSASDPVLLNGEVGAQDVGSMLPVLKIGDGVRRYSQLPNLMAPVNAANDYVAGSTTTLPAGSAATVMIDNTVDPPTISFGIPRGNTGPANSLAIGTVTTSPPGGPAGATITGTPPNQTLSLTLPQGQQGPQGNQGPIGNTGPANSLAIGTVTTGAPGSPAGATITGTPPNQILSLTIPQGLQGPKGDKGDTGSAGTPPGADTQMVFNDAATFGAAPGVTYAKAGAGKLYITAASHFSGAMARAPGTTNVSIGADAGFLPAVSFVNASAVANQRIWQIYGCENSGNFSISTIDDAVTGKKDAIAIARSGTAVANLTFGNPTDNPTYNFVGTNLTTFGNVASNRFVQTANGVMYIRYDDNSVTMPLRIYNVGIAAADQGAAIDVLFGNDAVNAFPAGRLGWASSANWNGAANRDSYLGLAYARDGALVNALVARDAVFDFGNAASNPSYNFYGSSGIKIDAAGSGNARLQMTGSGAYNSIIDMNGAGGGASLIRANGEAMLNMTPTLMLLGSSTTNPAFTFLGNGLATVGGTLQISGGVLYMAASRVALMDNSDGYLRINNQGHYTNGLYIPGNVRIDGHTWSDIHYFSAAGASGTYLRAAPSMGLTYGSVGVLGANNNFHGIAVYDSSVVPTFMSDGTNAGIFLQVSDSKWLLRRSSSTAASTDYNFSAPSFNTTSSRRIKRETGTPKSAWTILRQLRPILYRLLADERDEQLGLIAEEVHEVCPWLSGDGKTVAYDRGWLLILAALQESGIFDEAVPQN